MPLYEYECKSCGIVVETLVRSNEAIVGCDGCGNERMEKLFSLPSAPSVKSKALPMASKADACGAPRCCGGGCG